MKKSVIFATVVVGLFASVAKAETCTVTNVVVAPLTDAHWTQNAPYNDYSPKGKTVFTSGWEAGCVATAAAQELYYWQWPWRLDAVHETSHPVLNESNLALRFDGNVPFDWESMQSSYGDGATLKQKHAAAHLVLACQSLVQMRFVSGGGEAMKNLPGTMEWFEYAGQVTPRASEANLAALREDFEWGSPVQTGINFKGYGGHEVVGLGYATGTNSVGDAKNLIWLNLGWGGGSDGWYDIGETDSSETIIKSVQLGFRPIKSVQIEPIAPVSGSSVTLNWHLPNCYTNKISGFTVAKKKLGTTTTTWSDDFSTVKGRSNNTNEVRIVNGALKAWDGTASGMYIWDEVFEPTADSALSYDVGSSHMSGMSVRFEARVDGVWQSFHTVVVNGGKETNYYNWGTTTPADPVSLASFAGKKIQLRFVVEYTTGGIFTSDDASMKIDNLSISNIKTFETVSTDSTIAASARSTTFSGLTTGETYAFTVTPVMSDNSAAVTQTATTTIGTPAAAPTINSVTMSPKGSNLVQEGFYADIAMGWNIIDVACSESVTTLEAFISHQSVLPQSKIEVVDNGSGNFSINIDATEVAAKWANQKMILTLKATNATGENCYKDVELCLKASGVPENIPGGKVWTGASAMFGAENYTAKWSGNVLPSAGDKVTFKTTDAEFGGEMNLNLSTPTALGYVYATGDGQLTISGTSSETLTANVLKNDIQVEINSSKFKVEKAIPSANIVIDSGSCLDCEIDQSRSDYIKKVSGGYVSALADSSLWKGTVVFANYTAAGQNPSSYGNAESTVRLNGVDGWLANNTTFTPAVELVDDGATPALNWNNGSTNAKETFKKLKGSGTFKTSGSGGAAERVVINDIDDFTGSFDLSLKRIAIGTADPTTSNNGSITVNSGKSVAVHGGSTWKVSGGFYFGGSQTITVDGALNGAISANGTGTVLALAPTATVTAASLSFANNTIRLAKTAEASPTFSVTGAANLTNATIEVALSDGMSVDDSIALMSAGSFEGVDSATLVGLDGYSLEVSGGTLYATKDIPPTPDATSLEESEGFVTSESQLAFKDATLAMLTSEALGGKFGGAWAGTADGAAVVFNNFDRTAEAAGTITCQAQVANDGYVKGVLLTFTQSGGNVYVLMTGAKYIQGASLGDSIAGGSDASQNGEWKYAVSALSLKYLGPAPMAVWVAGEFDDDRSAHGGLEISLNGNTTNALGQIVIGNSATLGATISLPAETHQKVTMLVKYSIPSGGAPVTNSVPASMFSTYDLGARAVQGSSALDGYWLNGSTVTTGYAFSNTAPTILEEGYILISTYANKDGAHGTAVYTGETIVTLAGGEKSGLRFTGDDHFITSVGIGGPTVEGAVPWAGMVIKSVAIFDEWVAPTDLATYRFPGQGAVLPEDSDLYAIEPAAKWVNDFKTTEKNGCTLSVSGTTAAKDDSFGGTLTIGDASAVIDTTAAATSNMTVLIKYRAASNVTNAPVVAFGAPATYGLDVGVYTKLDKTLAVYRNFSTDNGKPYNFSTDPVLSAMGGYVLCARDSGQKCMAYVGDSLDAMTGEELSSTNIKFSNLPVKSLGIGGNSSFPANANDMVPYTGFVVEKIVIFSGYYTPDQIRHVAIPEDSDTLSIADGKTWRFAAGTTRTYTNIGTLSTGGTIAITNAATLAAGTYTLATWTTAQKKSTGYGRVGTLDVTGLPAGLSAELVYGAKAIYLRVWNPTTQAEKGTIKVWPYGDSITEGFNAGGTRANYRVLLAQKLSMLGYNVEMVGCYDKINNAEGIDPSGQVIPDAWKWHSAKHGATAGPTTSAAGRANLCENVDTLCAQAGNPDVVLLLAGANDIVPATGLTATQVVASVTNIVAHLAANLPDTKIVVGNQINVEQGYNSGNYTHVTNMIPQVNALLKDFVDNLPVKLVGKVFLADLNSYVKSGEYGILFDHGSDHLHPDWWGHDQMAEGWLSIVTNQFTSTQTFPSAAVPSAPTAEALGAAAKTELEAYRQGFKLARRIDAASNLDTANPYAYSGDGATENIEKVAYFVEYVRADNNAHKWVWVDMDAFGTTIDDVGLPAANHQQVVTKLHIKSNHNGIEDVAANDDSITGFVEFSPYGYNGNVSGVSGAPAGNGSCCDWNDTLSESGSYSCMQVHRVFSPAKAAADGITRGGQVLFAYNNWQSSSSTAEFGIGNFSSHFYRGASDAQTLDYTYTANAPKINASAYSVKRIEIWTKEKATDTDFPTPYSWIDMYFPELVSGWSSTQYNDFATNKNHGSVKNGYAPWESYMLGLEPTNEQSKLTVQIRMDGTTPVVEFSPTNETMAIQYILQGKPTLTNDWQDVEFDEPGDTNRFFRVRVTW
ncbi:MAG: C10 family peptidase [Kiritimatiellae bacterium]|nr:C10 family peptidase [Kiritimatiellia bacterium]